MHLRSVIPSLSVAFLLCGFAPTGGAAEKVSFTTRDGHQFEDVTVSRVVGRRLELLTPKGTQVVRFSNLPRELQERFFDPSLLHPPKVGDLLEFKSLDGRSFNGPLREVAPNGISIGTPDGVEKVAYSNLPPELANTFDYDAEDAARYEAALKAQQHRAALARQAAEKKAATQRAPAGKSTTRTQPTRPSSSDESTLGSRGTQNLGAPKLGGRGLGK